MSVLLKSRDRKELCLLLTPAYKLISCSNKEQTEIIAYNKINFLYLPWNPQKRYELAHVDVYVVADYYYDWYDYWNHYDPFPCRNYLLFYHDYMN